MAPKEKERLDVLLVKKGLAPSRERAQALIMRGSVWHEQQRLDKPGMRLLSDCNLRVDQPYPWVSRSAEKLLAALDHFSYPVENRYIMDIGSSTGGFSEVLLSRQAHRVIGVDVGSHLIHPKVKQDPRFVMMENCNARLLSKETHSFALDAIVIDVSFIRLQSILPGPLSFLKDKSWLIALIKPQFQLGRGDIQRGGIVKNPLARQQACREVATWLTDQGLCCDGILASPVKGKAGNQEFLIGARKADRWSS